MVCHFCQETLDNTLIILAPEVASQVNAYHDFLFGDACIHTKKDTWLIYNCTFKNLQGPAVQEAQEDFTCFKMELDTKFATKWKGVLEAAHHDLTAFQLVHA